MAQGARYRPNTGCAKVSFDQSLSSISQFRCCVQGLHELAQVALVYLDVSKTFCFPGITSGTVSPGPISKYPGRAPKGTLWRPRLWGWGVFLRVAGLSCLGGDFFCWLTRACTLQRSLFGHTLSKRRGRSTPHGFAYCKSSSERWVGSPAGQYPCSSSSCPPWVVPGTALVSSCTGSYQQSPALWLRLAPSATPRCFPISDARRVYLVDSFIARDPQYNAHTTSLILTLSGHTFSG